MGIWFPPIILQSPVDLFLEIFCYIKKFEIHSDGLDLLFLKN